MYTEKSIDLKSDFYARYGEAWGKLIFEKVGVPCVALDGGSAKLIFALDCGVRAYGRGYGDVLRVLNSETNVCDVHFVKNGKGAQILYKTDIPDIRGTRETVLYTVNKLLYRIGSTGKLDISDTTPAICDRYAPTGWCAVKDYDTVKSAPLPLNDYNVLLIRTRKNKLSGDEDMQKQFRYGERRRIEAAFRGLKDCKIEALFDMMNESQKSIERLLSPSDETLCAVHSTYGVDGIDATRVCDCGIISFCLKEKTDSAILRILNECRSALGYSVSISVVK